MFSVCVAGPEFQVSSSRCSFFRPWQRPHVEGHPPDVESVCVKLYKEKFVPGPGDFL